MARKRNDDHIRTITKVAGGKSYCITLPIKIVREMNWESQQKVLVKRRGNKIIIMENDIVQPEITSKTKFSISQDADHLSEQAVIGQKEVKTKARK